MNFGAFTDTFASTPFKEVDQGGFKKSKENQNAKENNIGNDIGRLEKSINP